MVSLKVVAGMRQPDNYGEGHYLASRGSRDHHGIDFACAVGTGICSTVSGEVTKLGYPYAEHLEYRYVEVTCEGLKHRFFYIEPCVILGDSISVGDVLGHTQELGLIYPNAMTEHTHYEVMQMVGNKKVFKNPEDYLE